MNCKSKKCGRPLPTRVFQWSNRVALEEGFCSSLCMFSELGDEKTWGILNAYSKGVSANDSRSNSQSS